MEKSIVVCLFCTFIITALHAGTCMSGNCYSGEGIYQFDSGGKYSGTFRNGKMHGYGSFVSRSGTKYVGAWYNGKRQGKGEMRFANGDFYSGDFRDNRLEGHGKIKYAVGDSYIGSWKYNKANGSGKYYFKDGDIYTGKFIAGKFHGKGTMQYANGSSYVGYWADNKKHGRGTYTDTNGRTKNGLWKYGKMTSGSSKPIYQNPVNHTPIADRSHSQNTREQRDYTKPHPDRPASNSDANRRRNQAQAVESRGVYTFSDGTEYIGTLVNGLPNGLGKVRYNNGDRYDGEWKHYNRHGVGVLTYANGRQIRGQWANGKLIQKDYDSHQAIDTANERYGDVKVWAVIVGISEYTTMPTLKYTDDDAYRMYAFLKSPEGGAVPDDQIRILIDQGANRTSILKTVRETFAKADPNDVVFFYYSGHGLSDSFVPVDFNGYANLLSYKDVVAALDMSQAKNKICIADACYAGGIDNVKTGERMPQKEFYDAFKRSKPGTALFLSSKQEEFSLEDHGLRSGVFSHYLIKALKGEADFNNNGIVTIQEAFDYVGTKVETYTRHRQTPMLAGNYDPNIPLASLR